MSAPRLFFSFRSPYSWLLVERMRRCAPAQLARLELIPYWEPDERTAAALAARGALVHYAAMSRAKHLYLLQDTKRIAARLGVPMRWPVDVDPWWEPAHLGWLCARHMGAAASFYEAVIAARWERAENVSDPAVLRAAADAAGLDGAAISRAPDDPSIRAEGVACLHSAYEEDVFGVPYLRLGWRRFWGYDRLDDFLAACGEGPAAPSLPLADVPPAIQMAPGMYDTDAAGGCG